MSSTTPAGSTALLERPAAPPVLQLRGIHQRYGSGEGEVHALRGIDLTVTEGEYVAIMGPSGSGKSTLMNLLGCLDVPTEGDYILGTDVVGELTEAELAKVRNRRIGFIFQSFNLIPRMSAQANVELPLVYGKVPRAERRERAAEALAAVGLTDRADHKPQALSGGQQQRVAVARALVSDPTILLADEPTGNLDSKATDDVLDIFDRLWETGRTIVVITHEDQVGAHAGRTIHLRDGLITTDQLNDHRHNDAAHARRDEFKRAAFERTEAERRAARSEAGR